MNMKNPLKVMLGAIVLASTSACIPEAGNYTGVATPKRNEVQMVRLTHVINFSADQELDENVASSLDMFLAQYAVGYGDVLSLDAGDEAHQGWREALDTHLISRGLRLDNRTVVSGPMPAHGTAILVVDRYLVTTPACNDYSQQLSPNPANARSPNYGCSNQALLGLMVANPRDLIQGGDDVGPNSEAASAALRTYRQQAGQGVSSRGSQGGSGVHPHKPIKERRLRYLRLTMLEIPHHLEPFFYSNM